MAFIVSIYQPSLAFGSKGTPAIQNDNEFRNTVSITCSMPYFTRDPSTDLVSELKQCSELTAVLVQKCSIHQPGPINAGFKETNRCAATSTTLELFPPQDMSKHLSSAF